MSKPKPQAKPVTITLTIDSGGIYGLDPGDPKVKHHLKLSDDNSGSNQGSASIEQFESYVTDASSIDWKVVQKDEKTGSKVKLISVSCNTFLGPVTVKKSALPVMIESGSGVKIQEYTINFSVSDTDKKNPKNFSLDPKIRLNPPS